MPEQTDDRYVISDPARFALLGVVALSLAAIGALASGAVTVASLVTPGGQGPAAAVITADFGADAVDPDLTGYDGQQVYAIARDFPDLDAASEHLDAPAYRMVRILPPALASPAPAGSPTVLALLAINIAGFGLAVYGGGKLLESVGGRPAVALLAASVLLLGVATTTVGPIAWGLTLLGMHLSLSGRHGGAIAALVLAALSRETASVAAACIGGGLWLRGTPLRQMIPYALPGCIVGLWYLIVSALVDDGLPTRFDPLGFMDLPTGHAALAVIVAGLGVFAAYMWRDRPGVSLSATVFTAWMAVYTVDILDPLALFRVNALPVVLGILAIGRVFPRAVEPARTP